MQILCNLRINVYSDRKTNRIKQDFCHLCIIFLFYNFQFGNKNLILFYFGTKAYFAMKDFRKF